MVMTKVSYEAKRQQTIEENKKRMQELRLPRLTQALKKASTPNPPPSMRKTTPRVARTEVVPVRRSLRFTDKPAPEYREVTFFDRVQLPGRGVRRPRNFPTRDISYESRDDATRRAEEFLLSLGDEESSFVKSMLPSHVSGCFWLGLPAYYCKTIFPKTDGMITLVDEEGDEWPVVYLARKSGMSGGWKKFAMDHELEDGDALVIQRLQSTVYKVFILRADGTFGQTNVSETGENGEPKAD